MRKQLPTVTFIRKKMASLLKFVVEILLFAGTIFSLMSFVTNDDTKSTSKIKKLQIGVKKRVESCETKSKKGDVLHMHYKGTLEDGTEFDNSYKRGEPLSFTLGSGQVIRGWDQGLLKMCEGEKRKLVIPPDLGYGSAGAPPTIPGDAVLVFEVELIKIERKSEL
ncbi:peptidyl-prolyl cis-trans isomerase FKBP2 [Trichonephila inaurata madagascariensis]|uniref:peptidylprolyl isomerase n=1 Tax=Trichonephila inaurata madagascariensis TaxID=2747483 RepID=A0A8X6Y5W6_9ARAC|nr:peptidyl-prolyl cis-trans isomerase FKBP2 [Trichonephila inaurata madagascariensis]